MLRIAYRFQERSEILQDRYCRGVLAPLAISLLSATILLITSALPSLLAKGEGSSDSFTAGNLLQHARENREVLSEDFPGFRSQLTVRLDGRVYRGTCLFRPPGMLKFDMRDGDLPNAVQATVRSMLLHRLPTSRTLAQSARYGPTDDHPLGREVLLDDAHESTYRIRNKRILQVDRRLQEPRLVLTVLSTETTASGRYLPEHVFAVLLDKESGAVREAWTYISRFQEVGGEYLPRSRQVIRTRDGRISALHVEWHGIELLDPVAAD